MSATPSSYRGSHLELDDRLSSLVRELRAKDAEARELRVDLQFLEDAEALNLPSEHPGGPRIEVPAEEGRELIEARNLLKSAYDGKLKAQKVKLEHSDFLAKVAAQTDTLRAQLDLMQEAACWKPGDAYGYIDRVAISNEVEGWRRAIGELLEEQADVQKEINLQVGQLGDLSRELDALESADEDLFKAETDLKATNEQIRLAKDEIVTLQRILTRKEKMVDQLEGTKVDKVGLRALEAEKRLAASKLSKHREAMRQNDVMIRNQALRIQKLEDKLELIGEAIRGDDGEEVDRIDVEILLDVQKEIQHMKATASRQTQDLTTMDEKVESAEACFRTMIHQRQVTQRRIEKATVNHAKQTAFMQEQTQTATKNAQRMLAEQRIKIERCTSESSRVSRQNSLREQREAKRKAEDDRIKREEAERKERLKKSRASSKPPPKKKSDPAQEKKEETKKEEGKHADPNKDSEPTAASEEKKAETEETQPPAKVEEGEKKSELFSALDIIEEVTYEGLESVFAAEEPHQEISTILDGLILLLGEQRHSWSEAKVIMKEDSTLPQLRSIRECLTKGEMDVTIDAFGAATEKNPLPPADGSSSVEGDWIKLLQWMHALLPYHEEVKAKRTTTSSSAATDNQSTKAVVDEEESNDQQKEKEAEQKENEASSAAKEEEKDEKPEAEATATEEPPQAEPSANDTAAPSTSTSESKEEPVAESAEKEEKTEEPKEKDAAAPATTTAEEVEETQPQSVTDETAAAADNGGDQTTPEEVAKEDTSASS